IEVAAARRELGEPAVSLTRVGEHDDVDALCGDDALELVQAADDVLAGPVVESPHDLVAPFAGDGLADEGGNPAVADDEQTPGPARTRERDRSEQAEADCDDDGEQRMERREAPSVQAPAGYECDRDDRERCR